MLWQVSESWRLPVRSGLVLCWVLGGPGLATAQHEHTFLPPPAAATPLSAQIQSEAYYVSAYGDMMESAATARKINAEAVAMEIENSVAYVDAYFERRELNREWRRKEGDLKKYSVIVDEQQKLYEHAVEEQSQMLLRGDVTTPLNWLLGELSGPVVAYQYMPSGQESLIDTNLDRDLIPPDLKQIRLTDGGGKASQLVFAASDGEPFRPHWPLGLRSPECAPARENYERTLENIVAEITGKGQTSFENETQVMRDVEALFTVLEEVYPKGRREKPAEFLTYATARRFLQSSLATSHRAITSTDQRALAGGLVFRGDSVVELLEHMYKNGLAFARPEPGGEGVYKKLFQDLRGLYLKVGPNRPAADVQKRDK